MGLLSWLFGNRTTEKPTTEHTKITCQPRSTRVESEPQDPSQSSWEDNRDILDGLEFNAVLQLTTPLSALLHHKEIFKGPECEAPIYSPNYGGYWVPKTKSWRELGFDIDDSDENIFPSDIGPVPSSKYLPFLVEFRKIVEDSLPIPEQIKKIRSLRTVSSNFASIYRGLKQVYPEFPKSFFIDQLLVIPGVGPKTAKALFEAGYLSIAHINGVSTERLAKVRGIGPSTAKKVSEFVANYCNQSPANILESEGVGSGTAPAP